MKKLYFLFTFCCATIFSSFAQNLVPNGDFEIYSTTTPTTIQSFTSWFESNVDMQPETGSGKISGNASVRFVGAGVSNVRSLTSTNSASIPVTIGNTYKLTFTSRIHELAGASGTNTNSNVFTAKVFGTSADGVTNSPTTIGSITTTSETNTTITFNFTPTDVAFPKIKIQFSKNGGIAYLDDVTLEDLGVLPITLSSFTGEAKNYGVKLNWTTAQEVNNQYFEILRAGEDKIFTTIGKVNGAINSSETKNYSFDDISPLSGVNYYQLKQVDLDGKSSSFGPIAVEFGLSENNFKVLSTSESSVLISISSSEAKEAIISYISLEGRILYKQQVSLSNGLNSFTIPVNNSHGKIGVINFTSGGVQKSIKVAR